jgi:excisionase family DNA binding protein
MSAGDAMIDAIADAVAQRLEKIGGTRQRLLTSDAAVAYLGISEDTLQRLVADKRLTPVRVDRRLRFDIRDLDRLIDDAKKAS